MKNGLFTITTFENDHGLFGGIEKVWYFLSCFQGTKRLIRMFTAEQIKRSG